MKFMSRRYKFLVESILNNLYSIMGSITNLLQLKRKLTYICNYMQFGRIIIFERYVTSIL